MRLTREHLENLIEEHCGEFYIESGFKYPHKVSITYESNELRVFFNPAKKTEKGELISIWRNENTITMRNSTVLEAAELIRDVHVQLNIRPELVSELNKFFSKPE